MCSYSGCVLSSVPESLSATYYHSRREACMWKEKQRELGNITGYGAKFDMSLHNDLHCEPSRLTHGLLINRKYCLHMQKPYVDQHDLLLLPLFCHIPWQKLKTADTCASGHFCIFVMG